MMAVDYVEQQIDLLNFADFSADVHSGEIPLKINFKSRDIPNIDSWLWDFGDGETSLEKNPSHTYTVRGIYDVSLIMAGNSTSSEKIKTDYIKVGPVDGIFYPSQNSHDYTWYGTTFNSAIISMGAGGDANAAIVFDLIYFSQGSIISTSHIKFRSANSNAFDLTMRMYFNDVDNAEPATNVTEAEALVLTGNYIDWVMPNWVFGTWYQSPELKTILQPVFDHVGFASEKVQVVLKFLSEPPAGSGRHAYGHDDGIEDWYPALHITMEGL